MTYGASGLSRIIDTPLRSWIGHTLPIEDHKSVEMAMGLAMEPVLLDIAEGMVGPIVRHPDPIIIPGTHLRCHLDGLAVDPAGPVIEVKTAGLTGAPTHDWGEPGTDEIPTPYLFQVQAYMRAANRAQAVVIALVAGRGTLAYWVQRSDELAEIAINMGEKFWNDHVLTGVPPTGYDDWQAWLSEAPLDLLRRVRRVPNTWVTFDRDGARIADEWENARRFRIMTERIEEAAKARVLLLLGTAEAAELPDGRVVEYMERGNGRTLRLKAAEFR